MPEELPDRNRAAQILRPGQIFDPVARALDLLGDRWTLVLVRHLLGGARRFQELRIRTGIAPRVLSLRLRQLVRDGFITTVREGGARSLYALTEQGRTLEPIVAAIARWWVLHAMEDHAADRRFTETSPQSILESLPFLLRDQEAEDVDLAFEIRLSGPGGGVWTVRIRDGACTVTRGFAERADVRYTADARDWCRVALGHVDAREAVKRGALIKDGGAEALDRFFYQISYPDRAVPVEGGAPVSAGKQRRQP